MPTTITKNDYGDVNGGDDYDNDNDNTDDDDNNCNNNDD